MVTGGAVAHVDRCWGVKWQVDTFAGKLGKTYQLKWPFISKIRFILKKYSHKSTTLNQTGSLTLGQMLTRQMSPKPPTRQNKHRAASRVDVQLPGVHGHSYWLLTAKVDQDRFTQRMLKVPPTHPLKSVSCAGEA